MVFKAWKEETVLFTTWGGQVRNLNMIKKKQQQKAQLSSSLPSPPNLELPSFLFALLIH